MDENTSWYIDENIKMFGNTESDGNEDFEESNLMHGKYYFY